MELVEKARRELIKNIIIMNKVSIYVELGVGQCEQINMIVPYVNTAIGIDINDRYKYRINDNATFLNISTNNFYRWWKKRKGIESIDLLFIDADHSYTQSYIDFLNYRTLVKYDGLILFHDSYPSCKENTESKESGEVWRTIWDIRKKHPVDFEVVTIPGECGLSIVRKANRQLKWIEK